MYEVCITAYTCTVFFTASLHTSRLILTATITMPAVTTVIASIETAPIIPATSGGSEYSLHCEFVIFSHLSMNKGVSEARLLLKYGKAPAGIGDTVCMWRKLYVSGCGVAVDPFKPVVVVVVAMLMFEVGTSSIFGAYSKQRTAAGRMLQGLGGDPCVHSASPFSEPLQMGTVDLTDG